MQNLFFSEHHFPVEQGAKGFVVFRASNCVKTFQLDGSLNCLSIEKDWIKLHSHAKLKKYLIIEN